MSAHICFEPTIDSTIAGLSTFYRKYSKQIWVQIAQKIVSEQYMTPVRDVTGKIVYTGYMEGNMHQPFRCEFEPLALGQFVAREVQAFRVKIDKSVGCLEDLAQTFLSQYDQLGLTEEPQDKMANKFVDWLITTHWGNAIAHEREYASFRAVRNNSGTSHMDMLDGWGTILDNEIAAGNLTPIPTGSINPGNIMNVVDDFIYQIPAAIFEMGTNGVLVMSQTMADWLYQDRITQYGSHTYFTNPDAPMVLGPPQRRVRVVGLPGMEGSQKIMYTPKWNWLHLYNRIDVPNTEFDIQRADRCMKVLMDYYCGYDFVTMKYVYTNEQPGGTLPAVGTGNPVMFI